MMTEEDGSLVNLTDPDSTVSSFTDLTTTAGPAVVMEHPPWLSDMELMIRAYVIPSLCAIGILFNSTSAIVLFHSELQVRHFFHLSVIPFPAFFCYRQVAIH
jgi:hypothetical protein